ncbi:MAG: HAMP domain-containing protein [Verrucomicrobia bacterium]|nr:HAMP domain-containing protein [Verrucomicrobiota bacterium]
MAFQDKPIRQKLMTIILGTSGVVLLLTCSAFLAYEFFAFRQTAVRQLSTLGEIVAANSTAVLAFDNAKDAEDLLSTLRTERHITAACLYNQDGRLFARYPANLAATEFPAVPDDAAGYRFGANSLEGFMPVVQVEGQRLGTLYLKTDLDEMYARLWLYSGVAALVILLASLVAYTLSRKLQRQISDPIFMLAETAKAISHRRDYSVRARKHGEDELGVLTDAFNHMLAEIQQQNAVLEQRVRERTAELELANDELESFCVSAAHDLRTPLRTITGFADIILDPRATIPPAEMKRFVGLIRTGSSEMSELIQALLGFSRLGRRALTREAINLEAIARNAYRDLAAEREGRQVEFRVDPLPTALGDRALLGVVMTNLLSNALKYSRPREVAVIHVGAMADEREDSPVYFVRDNGVGFDLGQSARLFGVFQRFHLAHEFEGTGIGLATVRRVIERHGGRIWAESQPGAGATFFFTLPVSPGPAAAEAVA